MLPMLQAAQINGRTVDIRIDDRGYELYFLLLETSAIQVIANLVVALEETKRRIMN